MGYYIKHIVTINEDSDTKKLENLKKIIDNVFDYNFKIYDDHLDDYNWNTGLGTSHMDDNFWEAVSEKFGEIPFTVHCVTEDGAIYDLDCFNGVVNNTTYRETNEWYKMYQDETKRSPGANKGYYDDPGQGKPYPIKYGGMEEIPAGNMWWLNNDKKEK